MASQTPNGRCTDESGEGKTALRKVAERKQRKEEKEKGRKEMGWDFLWLI